MTSSALSDYLDSWGRWCRDQFDCWPMGYAPAAAVVGQYHSPQHWTDPEMPRSPIFVDWAWAVEDAVHDPWFLPRWRAALKATHVTWPSWRLMDAGVKPHAWDDLRAVAASQAVRTYEDSLRAGTGALAAILDR